jgi:hypothetical protein
MMYPLVRELAGDGIFHNKTTDLITMCVGGGRGMALIRERV